MVQADPPTTPPPCPDKAWQRALDERVKQPADIRIVLGASGTGKSHYLNQVVKEGRPRLLIWDPKHEYTLPRAVVVHDRLELAAAMMKRKGPWIFRPSFDLKTLREQFDQVCAVVQAAQRTPTVPRLFFMIEELSDIIQNPANPPELWRQLTVQPRHFGVTLIAAGQRPRFADATFLSNATLVRVGRLQWEADAKKLGQILRVDWREVMTLPDREGFIMKRGQVERF